MSKTDGEYELVLGNRQLLSAFFIIVIMFGVFFTMGYVVGRNSAPPAAASAANTAVTAQRPEAPAPAPPPQQDAKESVPVESKPAETRPVETRPVETKPVAPPEARPAPPARADDSSGGVAAVKPGPGNMYLQVAAAAQPQAGVVVDTLKQKGFPALLAQGPNATLFRVMVGPFADAATLGKAKADLENAGFRPLVRK
jgi:cell division protein FtsN